LKIGILGAGRMASALAPGWIVAGHDVMIGGRTRSEASAVAERTGARAGGLADAAAFGEATLLAVLYAGVDATLDAAGADDGALRGRVLIDITNPVNTQTFLLYTPELSIAEQIAQRTGADVVKTLHQVHGAVYAERARFADAPLVVPMAGSERGKAVVAPLIRDLGAEPLDAGDLEQARNLEAMAAVVVRQLFSGQDPLSAFQWQVGRPARRGV
jgi:predicted dinucleotide-binding enzyme